MRRVRRFRQEVTGIARVCGAATAARYLTAILRSAPEVLRARSLSPADRLMWSRTCTFDVDGTSIELDGKYFAGARELYCRRVYLQPRAMRLCAGDTVIDLGANAGLFTLLAAKRCRRVIAVEAQAGFMGEIETLLKQQRVGHKVRVENALMGAEVGLFSQQQMMETASHFGGVTPPRITMEELLAKHGIERVDFLKSDIEGSEFGLIRQPEPWLERVQRIAMEVHANFGDPQRLAAHLRGAGFTVELRDSDLRPEPRLGHDGYLYAWRVAE